MRIRGEAGNLASGQLPPAPRTRQRWTTDEVEEHYARQRADAEHQHQAQPDQRRDYTPGSVTSWASRRWQDRQQRP